MQGPAVTVKVPAEDSRVIRVRRLLFPTSDRLQNWLIPGPPERPGLDNIASQPWSDATCPCTTSLLTSLCHALFVWKDKTKYYKRWHRDRGKFRQFMVDSWYCLDRVVAEGMSQVWKRSEVGNNKRRTLITRRTRLSSGTSAGTFTMSANYYMNNEGKEGTKNEPESFLYQIKKRVGKSILTIQT